ncbi:mannose-1-phosphate guanyltransferase [Pyrococcus sp. NA2]|uniref:sugar phosphate nucleotidyltransferase n=1 Tax=Pyrococcus sp. (strain NA2) TaxID=342949 RepID=UPI000209B03C|nr:NDP-sugar synthase [Pyrococcus sp. NA2]AEC51209.1 mannose-1-phosphate guanyltransferase [Pyrococcus sp. NA2]
MQAVLLAGGKGTRLLPLTIYRPKPMIPFFNRPLMEYILNGLVEIGVEDVIVLVGYLKEKIISYFGSGDEFGVKIRYSDEENLRLGTAGALKKVEKFIEGTFIVASSDVLTNLDLNRLVKFHKEKGGIATIALTKVKDPSHYGVAVLDKDFKIRYFKEKPRPEEAPSNLVNAGIYIFEPEVFDLIPKGENFDFSLDLFPRMLKEGIPIYGFPFDEYWNDVGRPSTYLQATEDVFLGKLGLSHINVGRGKGRMERGGSLFTGVRCILRNPKIVGFAVLGDEVEVDRNVKIERSVIFSNVTIEEGAEIREAIIGENVHIGRNSVIEPGSVIGDNSVIEEYSKIGANIKIWPDSRVGKGSVILPD